MYAAELFKSFIMSHYFQEKKKKRLHVYKKPCKELLDGINPGLGFIILLNVCTHIVSFQDVKI